MSFFVFTKNMDDVQGSICKIAKNQSDLDNLNIIKSDYKIIQDLELDFNLIQLDNKYPLKYNNNIITYIDVSHLFKDKKTLDASLENKKNLIQNFINNNESHNLFQQWSNYLNQLNSLNLDNINYPLNTSIEQYFSDLGQPSFNILQLP
jgi:hypothetical protein